MNASTKLTLLSLVNSCMSPTYEQDMYPIPESLALALQPTLDLGESLSDEAVIQATADFLYQTYIPYESDVGWTEDLEDAYEATLAHLYDVCVTAHPNLEGYLRETAKWLIELQSDGFKEQVQEEIENYLQLTEETGGQREDIVYILSHTSPNKFLAHKKLAGITQDTKQDQQPEEEVTVPMNSTPTLDPRLENALSIMREHIPQMTQEQIKEVQEIKAKGLQGDDTETLLESLRGILRALRSNPVPSISPSVQNALSHLRSLVGSLSEDEVETVKEAKARALAGESDDVVLEELRGVIRSMRARHAKLDVALEHLRTKVGVMTKEQIAKVKELKAEGLTRDVIPELRAILKEVLMAELDDFDKKCEQQPCPSSTFHQNQPTICTTQVEVEDVVDIQTPSEHPETNPAPVAQPTPSSSPICGDSPVTQPTTPPAFEKAPGISTSLFTPQVAPGISTGA